MHTREIAVEFRLDHWARIMQERVDSGQSIRAYCKANDIGTNAWSAGDSAGPGTALFTAYG